LELNTEKIFEHMRYKNNVLLELEERKGSSTNVLTKKEVFCKLGKWIHLGRL
jgi:hypothetical protein